MLASSERAGVAGTQWCLGLLLTSLLSKGSQQQHMSATYTHDEMQWSVAALCTAVEAGLCCDLSKSLLPVWSGTSVGNWVAQGCRSANISFRPFIKCDHSVQRVLERADNQGVSGENNTQGKAFV